ncbi:hypothetical protein QE152_g19830 [Popillia japonica]|uniref:Uncharacterized protein n=1 Tax=Popillia japonica TaxID=7064 RepID=A0AAW1KQB8_POPJA
MSTVLSYIAHVFLRFLEGKLDAIGVENIIGEIAQRENRKNNIIIFSLPELDNVSRSEQVSVDVNTISDIFADFGVSPGVVVPLRLGNEPKYTGKRQPQLKTSFKQAEEYTTTDNQRDCISQVIQNNVISSWRSLKVNVRYWLQENVHWTLKIRPQNLQKINLCVGIVEDPVPFNVPCLTGETYLACAMPKLQPL